MPPVVRNRRPPRELTDHDVTAALARIAERDEVLARDARHVYDTLTWGEGPGRIRRAAVQDWLWYQLPTKYLTDEDGYMARLAETAAVLFEELGLDAYAAVCRDERTASVHVGFERSDAEGYKAMRKARESSGIEPPELDDFAWGQVMGMEEANAYAAVEDTLEDTIDEGALVVGGRGWRIHQRQIAAAALDGDHPTQPGQSWRTVVVTERIGDWVHTASVRSPRLGRRRAAVANRLLHPIEPPSDLATHMAPAVWLLDRFGDEQPPTQAGYLNRAFLIEVYDHHPWDEPFGLRGAPRTETDLIELHRLRWWLESAGALRKRGKVLRRTARGAAMAADPLLAWEVLTTTITSDRWDRFVIEDAALILVGQGEPIAIRELLDEIAVDAVELGWRTTDGGLQHPPTSLDIGHTFHPWWALLELFGFAAEHGDWRNRAVSLSPAGTSTLLAVLRAAASGPRAQPG